MVYMFVFGMTGCGGEILKDTFLDLYRIAQNKYVVVACLLEPSRIGRWMS